MDFVTDLCRRSPWAVVRDANAERDPSARRRLLSGVVRVSVTFAWRENLDVSRREQAVLSMAVSLVLSLGIVLITA